MEAVTVNDVEIQTVKRCRKGRRSALKVQSIMWQRARATGEPFRNGGDFYNVYKEIGQMDREVFVAVTLDQKNRAIGTYLVSMGTLTASLVHPRESFRAAVMDGAAHVAFIHNHPSGNPQPSEQDRQLTRRLVEAGKILGIDVMEHVIVADGCYLSMAEREML